MNPEGSAFDDRRKALEDSFFRERDNVLLERLRGELHSMEAKKQLSHVSGITDDKILSNLVQAGVQAETLTALNLIPLVEVAWSDGAVSAEERAAVLKASTEAGIHPENASYHLLGKWLENRPDQHVVTAWKEYVGTLTRMMPMESVAAMRETTAQRCRRVAEAAGGFLGMGNKISKVEQSAIEEFARAWGA